MNHNAEQIKDEYHARLVSEGYLVRTQLPFEGINGKFALYAINDKTRREKLIQVKDFSGAKDAEPLIATLEALADAKTLVELNTFERRTGKPSELELELIGVNVKTAISNEFCKEVENTHTQYKQHVLHARVRTPTYKPLPTSRFVLTR